jgi:hypothetical protein
MSPEIEHDARNMLMRRFPDFYRLTFGDGYFATVQSLKDAGINSQGVDMIEIEFVPEKDLVWMHRLQRDQWTSNGTIVKKYPADQLLTFNRDPVSGSYLLLCDFNGEDTYFTKKHFKETQIYRDEIRELKKMLNAEKSRQAGLMEKYNKLLTEEKAHIKGEVDLIKEVTKGTHVPSSESSDQKSVGGPSNPL